TEVILFARNFCDNIEKVRSRLLNSEQDWGHYKSFIVKDPKERVINAAPLSERIMHHAMMNIIEPIFERQQIFHSYACRKGKGTQAAVLHAFKQTKRFGFFLKLDVRKYFDSIDQKTLMKQILRLIKDQSVLHLLHGVIASYHVEPQKGLPIGNLTSQYFANHYLSGLDHNILEHIKPGAYVRYMDDFILWHDEKAELKRISSVLHDYCRDKLKLELKASVIGSSTQGLPFLGFLIKNSGIYLLNKSKRRMKKRARQISVELQSGQIDEDKAAMKANSVNTSVLIARSRAYRTKLWKGDSQGLEPRLTWRAGPEASS
ncbi:MAG TPA: hypothetical protein DCG57_16965, partial [Candidatus Riflebacteria bacterium]|nr:hypothetical protein [Candidatus Riflebacteria bacterium]